MTPLLSSSSSSCNENLHPVIAKHSSAYGHRRRGVAFAILFVFTATLPLALIVPHLTLTTRPEHFPTSIYRLAKDTPPPPPPLPHSLLHPLFHEAETRIQTAATLLAVLNSPQYMGTGTYARAQKPMVFLKTYSERVEMFSSILSRMVSAKDLKTAVFTKYGFSPHDGDVPNHDGLLGSTQETWNFASKSQRDRLDVLMVDSKEGHTKKVTIWDAYSFYDPQFYAQHLLSEHGAWARDDLDDVYIGISRDPAERLIEAVRQFNCTDTREFNQFLQDTIHKNAGFNAQVVDFSTLRWDGREESFGGKALDVVREIRQWRSANWQCELDAASKTLAGAPVPGLAMQATTESNTLITKIDNVLDRMERDKLFVIVAERMLESVMAIGGMFQLNVLDMAFRMMDEEKPEESLISKEYDSRILQVLRDAQPLDSYLHKKADSVLNRRLKELYSNSTDFGVAMKNQRIMNKNIERMCDGVLTETTPTTESSRSSSPITIWEYCETFMNLDKQAWNDKFLSKLHDSVAEIHQARPGNGSYILYVKANV